MARYRDGAVTLKAAVGGTRRVLDGPAREGYNYKKYPYYYFEYGLTWLTRAACENLVAETTPEFTRTAYHPLDVDGHKDVFAYRKI